MEHIIELDKLILNMQKANNKVVANILDYLNNKFVTDFLRQQHNNLKKKGKKEKQNGGANNNDIRTVPFAKPARTSPRTSPPPPPPPQVLRRRRTSKPAHPNIPTIQWTPGNHINEQEEQQEEQQVMVMMNRPQTSKNATKEELFGRSDQRSGFDRNDVDELREVMIKYFEAVVKQQGEMADTIQKIDETVEGNEEKLFKNGDTLKDVHRDLKKGFQDLKNNMQKGYHTCDPRNFSFINAFLTGIVGFAATKYDMIDMSHTQMGLSVVGGGFFNCLLFLLSIVFKITLQILKSYYMLNMYIYSLAVFYTDLVPIRFIGKILLLGFVFFQLAVNFQLLNMFLEITNLKMTYSVLLEEFLMPVSKIIGQAIMYIYNLLVNSSETFFNPLFEFLDHMIPEAFDPIQIPQAPYVMPWPFPDNAPQKGRFVRVIMSLITYPLTLLKSLGSLVVCSIICNTMPNFPFHTCDCDNLMGNIPLPGDPPPPPPPAPPPSPWWKPWEGGASKSRELVPFSNSIMKMNSQDATMGLLIYKLNNATILSQTTQREVYSDFMNLLYINIQFLDNIMNTNEIFIRAFVKLKKQLVLPNIPKIIELNNGGGRTMRRKRKRSSKRSSKRSRRGSTRSKKLRKSKGK